MVFPFHSVFVSCGWGQSWKLQWDGFFGEQKPWMCHPDLSYETLSLFLAVWMLAVNVHLGTLQPEVWVLLGSSWGWEGLDLPLD